MKPITSCPFCNHPVNTLFIVPTHINKSIPENMVAHFCDSCRAYIATVNNKIIYISCNIEQNDLLYELVIDYQNKTMEITKRGVMILPNNTKVIQESTNDKTITVKLKRKFHNKEELSNAIKTYMLFS